MVLLRGEAADGDTTGAPVSPSSASSAATRRRVDRFRDARRCWAPRAARRPAARPAQPVGEVLGDAGDGVGAAQQRGRGAVLGCARRGTSRAAAAGAARARAGRRAPPSPTTRGLCACTTSGRVAPIAARLATPPPPRRASGAGRARRRGRTRAPASSGSSAPAGPHSTTSWPRAVSACASVITTRSAPPTSVPAWRAGPS